MIVRRSSLAAALLLAALAASLVVCRGKEQEEDRGGAAALELTPAERAERETKAGQLFMEAETSPVPDKVRIFRRLVTLFPESSRAAEAWHQIVFYSLHRNIRDGEAGLEAARTFAERHPDEPLVAEAFDNLDSFEQGPDGDPARRVRVQAAWEAFLDQWVVRHAGDPPIAKLPIWIKRAALAKRRGDVPAVIRILGEATRWDFGDLPPEDALTPVLVKEAYFDLGCALGLDPARSDEARAAFEAAYERALTVTRGRSREEIDRFLEMLLRDGRLTAATGGTPVPDGGAPR